MNGGAQRGSEIHIVGCLSTHWGREFRIRLGVCVSGNDSG